MTTLELPESTAVLADLALWDMRVDARTTGDVVDALFTETAQLPGIIIMDGERVVALLPRNAFYSILSRSFSREIYLRRAISMMVESLDAREPLVLAAGTAIPAAVEAALARTADHVYDPVIVDDGNALHLLEVEMLLRAQTGVFIAAIREKDWLLDEASRLRGIAHDLRAAIGASLATAERIGAASPELELLRANLRVAAALGAGLEG
jgi:hypothetical protein